MAGKVKARGEAGGDSGAVVVKKYANRRLYNTATSSYVTLDDLSTMVKEGVDFVVFDAKSGDDITRSVLTQIIFEQEGREGQNLLPITFLRRLIRFYGDSLQSFVPSFLDMSMETFSRQREELRERSSGPWTGNAAMEAFEEQSRKNMALFEQAMRMFTPFAPGVGGEDANSDGAAPSAAPGSDDAASIEEMRRQIELLQERLDALTTAEASARSDD